MAKKFAIPFANSGDKTAVPDGVQPDGSVSYTAGFGHDYELDKALDPVNAKDVPRDQTNQLFFDVTDAVGEIQKFGYALWSTDLVPYKLNAEVFHNDTLWRSTSGSNSGEPGVSTTWQPDSPGATSITMTNSNVTLTAQQAARSIIIISGTLTANLQLIFPAYTKQWVIVNNATGAFTITCKTASGSGAVSRPGTVLSVTGDGTNIVSGLTASMLVNGYQKLESGLIIQWGTVVSGSNGYVNWTYPIAFPKQALRIIGTCGVGNTVLGIGVSNATTVTVEAIYGATGAVFPGAIIHLYAIGY